MRIDPSVSTGITNAQNAAKTESINSSQAAQRVQQGTDGDQVDLSGASSLVALSSGLVSAARQAKIDTLAFQVQSGQYQVDAGQIASAIVNSMLGG